jgi:hypothetical protein
MDDPLHIAMTNGAKPFAGSTLHLSDLIPLSALQALLAEVVAYLKSENPEATLLRHADWHEHDGYLTASSPTTWEELVSLASSEESLYYQRPGDDFVQIGIYEANGAFYLRINVIEEDDDPEQYPGRWGSFDVSAPEPLLSKLKNALQCDSLALSQARFYFQQRSAA